MNIANFEGLGIKFNINNIAFNIFGVSIYWYAICIVLGFTVGILLAKKDDGKYGISYNDVLEMMIFIIPISIICARIYYVIFKFSDYSNNLSEIFNIRNGGLAIYGGIIGAFFSIIIFCKLKKIKVLDMLDYAIVFLPLGQAIGRFGNFFNGEAHGTSSHGLFRMGIIENGNYITVHPTFLYESICTFIIFIILYSIRNKRKFSGQLTCIYFLTYGIIRCFIESLRTDSLMIGNFRVSKILSILLSFICGAILVFKRIKNEEKISD